MTKQSLPGASTSLILGIVSILTSLLCCPFGIIFSIMGISKAKKAQNLYLKSPDLYVDYNNANIGKILSYIGLILGIAMLLMWILFFAPLLAFFGYASTQSF